jgi:Uma2 family endonuclease
VTAVPARAGVGAVRAVSLEAPEQVLAERRRLGLGEPDEVWDGVVRAVPPPGGRHQRLGSELLVALAPLAKRSGLVPSSRPTPSSTPAPPWVSGSCWWSTPPTAGSNCSGRSTGGSPR